MPRSTKKPEKKAFQSPFDVLDTFRFFVGIEIPDIITFVVGEQWLNQPRLYPRQATLLKVIFLRDDLFTDYDNAVLDEWEHAYLTTGQKGIVPHIRERITELKSQGRKWFREVLLVMGRRAGKGYISAICLAYILWHYMAKGNPQDFYGIAQAKKLVTLIFAGKRDQAKVNVFGDLVGLIRTAPCFEKYIAKDLTALLSIYAPNDFLRYQSMQEKGLEVDLKELASFEIYPKESTPMAGRGQSSWGLCFDEFAHIIDTGGNKDAGEVYGAAKPSLDQFGKDGFIIEPSSPWGKDGQFYENWQRAVAVENGKAVEPYFMGVQLASWDIYIDWEIAHTLHLFPEEFAGDLGEYVEADHPEFKHFNSAIQTYNDELAAEKKANPEKFAVERESQWATSLAAYLDADKVKAIFEPWGNRPVKYGPPELVMQEHGMLMMHTYRGHADPSKVNDKFGLAVGHTEWDEDGNPHCVFDLLHHFDPADFPNHTVDYDEINEWIWDHILVPFMPDFSFDQYASGPAIQTLQKRVRANSHLFKRNIQIYEDPVTAPKDLKEKEASKAAINLGRVHAPAYSQAELELSFLQWSTKRNRVDHPSSGPVQTKDVADAMMNVIAELLGPSMAAYASRDLSNFKLTGMSLQPGKPWGDDDITTRDKALFNKLSSTGSGRSPLNGYTRAARAANRRMPR